MTVEQSLTRYAGAPFAQGSLSRLCYVWASFGWREPYMFLLLHKVFPNTCGKPV